MARIIIKEVSNGFVVEFEDLQLNFRKEEIFSTFAEVVRRLERVKAIGDVTNDSQENR
jgi:hypothetical protein